MEFDKERFLKAGFVPREADVAVPALRDFFSPGSEPIWRVRSLSGHEIARVNDKMENTRKVRAILEGLVSNDTAEVKNAVASIVGNTEETPADAVRRMHLLLAGTVSPDPKTLDIDLASRLLQFFGVTFYAITNKILELSGRGYVPGKEQPSGTTTGSGPE